MLFSFLYVLSRKVGKGYITCDAFSWLMFSSQPSKNISAKNGDCRWKDLVGVVAGRVTADTCIYLASSSLRNFFWCKGRDRDTMILSLLAEMLDSTRRLQDGSGEIDLDELRTVMTSLGYSPTDKQLEDMMAKVSYASISRGGIVLYDSPQDAVGFLRETHTYRTDCTIIIPSK